jgi:hypothetical protein
MSPTKTAVLITTLVVSPAVTGLPDTEAQAQTTRTVYVSVTDNEGQPVTGLTPRDFRLREDNRDRVITSVEPAAERMRIVLVVEELLTPTEGVRQGLLDFVQAMAPHAEIALVVVDSAGGNREVVPYTQELNTLAAGVTTLPIPLRPQAGLVPEAIFDLATTFAREPPERPVMVVLAMALNAPEDLSKQQPQSVLNRLRDGNTQLHVVSVQPPRGMVPETGIVASDAVGQRPDEFLHRGGGGLPEPNDRAEVLTNGPKQSGGGLWPVNALVGVRAAMMSIANDLSNQYKLTYVLPAGVRPSDRLNVSINRRGVTLRAPTRIRAGG